MLPFEERKPAAGEMFQKGSRGQMTFLQSKACGSGGRESAVFSNMRGVSAGLCQIDGGTPSL